MPDHDWSYYANPVTGLCSYCDDVHPVVAEFEVHGDQRASETEDAA
jgi:hypothetical protein